MDKGLEFVIDNYEKLNKLTDKEEFRNLKKSVKFEFDRVKNMKKTGDAYKYFLRFANEEHKYAQLFKPVEKYGIITNEKMSDYLLEHFPEEIKENTTIDDFVLNNVYKKNDIDLFFGGRMMSGIRYNSEENIIAIITSSDSLYGDYWDDNGIFHYTGEGRNGDQSPKNHGNKVLIQSVSNGAKIYLFEKAGANRYYYRGEVCLSGVIHTEKVVVDGNERQVIKYPFKIVNGYSDFYYSEEDKIEVEKAIIKEIEKIDEKKLHDLARSKKPQSIRRIVKNEYVERDPVISKYTKGRANGRCDLCGKGAPFITKDGPYLESHHVVWISNGGPDVIYNTVALCPNCHRRLHALNSKKDIKKLQDAISKYLLDDNDRENLIKFEDLFGIKVDIK